MSTFVFNLLFLTVFGVIWIAILWLGIRPDYSKCSHLDIVSIHILPPVAIWLSWWIGRKLIKRSKARQIEEREKKAQAEQQASLEAARTKHEQEILQRRFACDCRLVAIGDLAIHGEMELPQQERNVWVKTVPADKKAVDLTRMETLDALAPGITQALRYVYAKCGAAAVFPLYILPPAEASGVEVVKRLRALHTQLIEELALPVKPKAGVPSILHLPSGDSASNSVIALFENTPDLPGAVVLAFGSPLSQAASLSDEAKIEQEENLGKPGHGVFALLLTHPDLLAMLDAIPDNEDQYENESLTPFWDKKPKPEGNLALLTLMPKQLRDELGALGSVARIHRAALGQTEKSKDRERVLELSRTFTTLLERAQINAGLIDVPFLSDAAAGQADGKKEGEEKAPAGSRCEWLVHNAGEPGRIGIRLSVVGAALLYFKIDRNPTEMATNIVSKVGNLGRATPIGMLAIALVQAQGMGAPALCAEFSEPDGIAVAFAVPAQASQPQREIT